MTRPLPRDVERRLLDYTRLAAYLGVSVRTAKQLAAEGRILKVTIGHRVLFDVRDVDEFIDKTKRSA